MSITFIIELEHLYHRITDYGMSLPNTVLTCKLLNGARLIWN